jgi:hypothetical protein
MPSLGGNFRVRRILCRQTIAARQSPILRLVAASRGKRLKMLCHPLLTGSNDTSAVVALAAAIQKQLRPLLICQAFSGFRFEG